MSTTNKAMGTLKDKDTRALKISILPPKDYTFQEIEEIKESLFLNVTQFCSLLGISSSQYYRFKNHCGNLPIRRLLMEIQYEPVAFLQRHKLDEAEIKERIVKLEESISRMDRLPNSEVDPEEYQRTLDALVKLTDLK